MSESTCRRELGRGERVLPGLWRLRLALPWPGVPHCDARALAAGGGVVLVDRGLAEQGSLDQLELTMSQGGLKLEDVRLLVCTHAHCDHYGQAADVIGAHVEANRAPVLEVTGVLRRDGGDPERWEAA